MFLGKKGPQLRPLSTTPYVIATMLEAFSAHYCTMYEAFSIHYCTMFETVSGDS